MRIRKSKVVNSQWVVTEDNSAFHWESRSLMPMSVIINVAIELLKEVFSWQITIQLVCADAGYRGELGDWLYLTHQCQLDIAHPLGQIGI